MSKLKLDNSICFLIDGNFLYKLSHGQAVAFTSLCHNKFGIIFQCHIDDHAIFIEYFFHKNEVSLDSDFNCDSVGF